MLENEAIPTNDSADGLGAETRIQEVGNALASAVRDIAGAIPGGPRGPFEVARLLGIDKVLASRVLKVARNRDPMAALHYAPGPEPLRRFVRAARKYGVPDPLADDADTAVFAFERLIREIAGDRSAFDAMLSAWLPEARAAIELRRKQAAFRAISQLKGAEADLLLCTAILCPSDDGVHIDVAWVVGLMGIKRLWPNACVKFASRSFALENDDRVVQTLSGDAVETLDGLRLDQFCTTPAPPLNVIRAGDVVHYTLAEHGFGSNSACELLYAEVSRSNMPRYGPGDQSRKRHLFTEVSVPVKLLVFDALIHRDVHSEHDPRLVIYDTACEGVADPNDPARDIDQLKTSDTQQNLGWGPAGFRSSDEPRYIEILDHVWKSLGWNPKEFLGHRCRIEYPFYGSQATFTWPSVPPPEA